MLCVKTDACNILRSRTNMQVNVMISSNIKLFCRHPLSPHLRDSWTTVQYLWSQWESRINQVKKIAYSILVTIGYKTKKTAIFILGDAKTKRKAIRTGGALWFSIHKRSAHTKINASVKIPL